MAAGLVMVLSELLLAGSLLTFQAPAAVKAIKAAALDMGAPGKLARAGLRERLLDALVICILYIPVSEEGGEGCCRGRCRGMCLDWGGL